MGASKQQQFSYSSGGEPHALRRKEILAKYGEQIRKLYGYDNSTAFWALLAASAQVAMAIAVRNLPWWQVIIAGHLIGGVMANNLTAALHELVHFLVFRTPAYNKYLALIINCPLGIPAAVGFRKYHLEHHSDMGVESVDVDVPTWVEANYITNTLAKLAYCLLYMACYSIRPLVISPKPVGKEDAVNTAVVVGFDLAMWYLFGWKSVLYMLAGIGLGGGLHPLAGHLIAEHYVFVEGQETYSYYGPANPLLYNVGYHNEHHDFPQIPGSRLHMLRKIAPEYYDTLHHHTSYTWVLWKFITDPAVGPWARIKRRSRAGVGLDVGMSPAAQGKVVVQGMTSVARERAAAAKEA